MLKKVATKILSDLGCPDSTELSISITGDRTITRINRDYLDKNRATNVISFSLQEGEFGGISPDVLGDVIISADTAAREAEEAGLSFFERLSYLLMHGILHLCGYDHERSGEEAAKKMEQKEKELFLILKREGLLNLTA